MKKILILFIILIGMTGCSNYHELNDLAIVSAIGIEKEEEKYKVTLELYKEVKESNSGSASKESEDISGTGKSIDEAINNSSFTSEKLLYFSHIQAIIIDSDLAKEGISSIMDYLSRNTDLSFVSYVVISDDKKPSEILSKKDINNEIIGDAISSIFNTTDQNNSAFVYNKYFEFLEEYINKNQDVYAPLIKVKDKQIVIEEMAVFKEDKMIDTLDSNKTKTFSLLSNNTDSLYYKLSYNDGYIVIRVFEGNSKIKIRDGKIVIDINVTSDIDEANTKINTLNDENIEKLNKKLEIDIKNDVKKLLKDLKEKDSDALGLNDVIYKTYGNLENDWKEMDIDIKVNNEITKKGLLMYPVRVDDEEN